MGGYNSILAEHDEIILAHGSGGKWTRQLLEKHIISKFKNLGLESENDSAVFATSSSRLAITTDSYVVRPLFFPGGDIGKLAVCGTINDLAVSGAKPIGITVSLILEEGLKISILDKILDSIAHSCQNLNIKIFSGDTKVVERGHGDGIFICTTGFGEVITKKTFHPREIQAGDQILITSPIGAHGLTILSARENLGDVGLSSDVRELWSSVAALVREDLLVHCLRDLTRGGLTANLIELANSAHIDMIIHEDKIPISNAVRGLSELLGLDPLNIANEGCLLVFIAPEHTDQALHTLRSLPGNLDAQVIGQVLKSSRNTVQLKTISGSTRILKMHGLEQLPRIC